MATNTTIPPGNVSNSSPQALGYHRMIFPKSPMPAWVPAVSVAIIMLVFLTISFYIRHRKVMRKRQILMDYFYIIFQYGGLRRKRMVTALCNTNAITLSHLGRSFMISFDNNENSCPFFTDETAFTKSNFASHSQSNGGISKAKNRLKIPFKRMMTQVEDGGNSVHDMLMKFKSKRKNANAPYRNKNNLGIPRRSSLSSIHGDDCYTFNDKYDIETTPRFKQRRNAYVIKNSETDTSSTMEMCSDGEEPELKNLYIEQHYGRRRSSGRRKSQIYHCVDSEEGGFHVMSPSSQNLRVLSLGTSISRKLSQGSFHQNSRQGSKNEPLIFIQTASTDMSSSQESEEIPAHYSKGMMVLQRVSRDQSTGDQYYPNESPIKYNQRKRKSLSTVSYVQSSNVNDYYQHCLHSPKRSDDELEDEFYFDDEKQPGKSKGGRGWRKGGVSKKHSPHKNGGHPPRRRTRLSLGDIGVGKFNFNQRFEESLGSMHEQDSEGSFAARLSKDLSDEKNEKSKSSSTWRRLKNVFAGIRWSQSSGNSKLKQSKSSTSEDRLKIRNKRINSSGSGKLNRFFNVLTGFRSLPEDKKYSASSPGGPKGSKSLPMGLDRRSFTLDDLEFHVAMAVDSKYKKRSNKQTSSSKSELLTDKSNRKVPPKTRSFPDNIFLFQGVETKTTPCLYHLHSDSGGANSHHRCGGRKSRRRSARSEDTPNVDFIHSPIHLSSSKSYYCRSGSSSPRSMSPVSKKRDRRYRSLSPLPERRNFSSSPRKGKNVKWYSHSARNSLSERGIPMSPSVRFNLGGDSIFQGVESIVKGTSLQNVSLVNSCVKCSCEDFQLLEVRTEQPCGEKDLPSNTDVIIIDTEKCVKDDSNTTYVQIDENFGSHPKDDCCSVGSDSAATNTEFLSIDSQSKSSQPTQDKTNSSLDSIYFDTFSVPSSPLVPFRTHALKDNNAASTSSLQSHCGDTFTSISTHSPTKTQSPSVISTIPTSQQQESQFLITVDETIPATKNSIPFPTSNIHTYEPQSQTTNIVEADSDKPLHHDITKVSDIEACEIFIGKSVTPEKLVGPVPKETTSISSLSQHKSDMQERMVSDEKPVCTNISCVESTSYDELCEESGPNADVFNESTVPLLRQATLEKQSSITSEEDMMNLTRLPRFGRRRSSQFASSSLASINIQEQKQTDESPLMESHSEGS